MAQVLKGLKVVEQGSFITGPAAAVFLADLGAEVIKIEQPGTGDPFRAFKGGLYSPQFQAYNRNKKSICLDTRVPADLEVFDKIIGDADVYIQNFRPATAEKLNVGAERLKGINDKLIYCAISGFGKSGPASNRPVYDTVAQAVSGFLNLLLHPLQPRVVGPAMADAITGFYAAYGILGALYERQSTGKGRVVDISMLEAVSHFNVDAFTHYFANGEVMGPLSRPSVSQSYAVRCGDGKLIALHMSSPPKFWSGLAEAISKPGLLEDPRFSTREARIENYEALSEELSAIFSERPRDEWLKLLAQHDVPFAPVYNVEEVLADEQAKFLGLEASVPGVDGNPFRTIRSPISYDGETTPVQSAPPELDQDRDDILARYAAKQS